MNREDIDRIRLRGPHTFEEAEATQQMFLESVQRLCVAREPHEILGYTDEATRWLAHMKKARLLYGSEIDRRRRELETLTVAQAAAMGLIGPSESIRELVAELDDSERRNAP